MIECNRCSEKFDSGLKICPSCGFETVPGDPVDTGNQPLAEFQFKAPFTKASVWLWNAIWCGISIIVTMFLASTVIRNGPSMGTSVALILGGWFAWISFKNAFSVWKTRISVYRDRVILKGVKGEKIIEFNKNHFMYYSPGFAGGWVLYLTEGYPDTVLGRLFRSVLHQRETLLHLYLMSDDDHRNLIELLSNLSGRPESEIRFARTFIPFYPREGEVYNAPTDTGVRKAVIVICVAGYFILLALWFICQSSKANSAILVVAILIPFVVVAAYVVGTLELESYREARNKDRKGKG